MKLSLSKTKKRVILEFDYDKEILELVKSIPGSKWEHEKKVWSIPIRSLGYLPENDKVDMMILDSNMEIEYNKYLKFNPVLGGASVISGCLTNEITGFSHNMLKLDKDLVSNFYHDWEKYRNPSAKRTKTLLTELNNSRSFIVVSLERLFKEGKAKYAYTALNAIQHPVAIDRAWFENRYCDPQTNQYGYRDIDGFSNKEELIQRVMPITLDLSILEV